VSKMVTVFGKRVNVERAEADFVQLWKSVFVTLDVMADVYSATITLGGPEGEISFEAAGPTAQDAIDAAEKQVKAWQSQLTKRIGP
jgi:hypothetical protein